MKQAATKFDNLDRKRVTDAVQEHYGVKLGIVGRRPKWLRDESGRTWWILGGVAGWHGIPKEMMEHEKEAQLGGILVIADRRLRSIEVFVGEMSQLVNSRDKLYPTKTGAYQFTVKVRGDIMQFVQVPAVVLERIVSIPHSDEDREQVRRVSEFKKTIARLSRNELKELLEKHGLNGLDLA